MSTYPSLYAGQKLTAALFTAGLPQIALKTADESVTNLASVQDDDQLFLPVESNASYAFTGWIWFTSPVNTADLRTSFTVPSGATMYRSGMGQVNGATAFNGVVDTSVYAATAVQGNGAYATPLALHLAGYVVTAGTAGNLQLRWGQVVADAVNEVRVKAGSWIRLDRVS